MTDELTGKLEGVSGVASVTVSGALTRQAHVILDQEKMEALSAKLADAVKAQLKRRRASCTLPRSRWRTVKRRCPTPNARRRTA